jgi:glycosyltransferase involved in cell wall biosynthesis
VTEATSTGGSLSVIIPAYNEGKLIGATLSALRRAVPPEILSEIIVVDNGSSDHTAAVAAAHGARVITQAGGTIAALRNTGVQKASGSILVFLDADVVVTDAWAARLPAALAALDQAPRTLTGYMCGVPSDASWIERLWFAPRDVNAFTHIGSGHLITTRAFLEEIGGFNPELATGEDHELSQRAMLAGGRIAPDAALEVEHHGFPTTLAAFIRREAWHGRSDFISLHAILNSKVAVLTVIFAGMHALALLGLLSGAFGLAAASAAAVAGICLMSSWIKYRHAGPLFVFANCAIFYAYYLGRTFSLLRLGPGSSSRGSRA